MLKTIFWGMSIAALASFSSLLGACSSATQTAAPQVASEPKSHDDMNHSMDLGPSDAEFDLRFIDAMTPHHQGALDMAKEAKQKSKRPEIQKLADNILNTQNQELDQMKRWRQAWYPKASANPVAYHSQMGHSMPMTQEQMKSMMMSLDLGAADADFDLRFINAMIPHHQGAVTMAQDALAKSQQPKLKQMAQEIIQSQNAEIKQMQQWKQAWYKQ